jgi:hypothetical protein
MAENKEKNKIIDIQKIEWQAPEYIFYEKSSDWFWAVGIITIAVFLAALFLKSFLFAVLIILAGFSIALYGARVPKKISFLVGPGGIKIKDRMYDYENLKSFWIEYNPPIKKELIIESKKKFIPHITILIEDINPEKLRNYLLQFLPEEKKEESLISIFFRWINF